MKIPFLVLLLTASLYAETSDQLFTLENLKDPPQGPIIEDWMELFMNGEKIGFERISIERDGDTIVTRTRSHTKMGRDDSTVSTDTVTVVREELSGTPLSIKEVSKEGVLHTTMDLEFVGNEAMITKTAGGRTWDHKAEIEPGFSVSWGMVLELAELIQGEPGNTIQSLVYYPELSQNAAMKTTTTYEGIEEIDFRGEMVPAHKLQQTIILGFIPLKATIWMSMEGKTLLGEIPIGALEMTLLGATEEQAKAAFEANDLFTDSLVSLNEEIAFGKSSATYRIRTKNKATSTIQESLNQSVIREDDTTYLVKVTRGELSLPSESLVGIDPKYLAPSRLVDYEDPVIQDLIPDGIEEMEFDAKLRALVDATYSAITNKSMEFGYATASEAAKEQEGDCTEHALLLAAMARSIGIPARGATGLVGFYDEQNNPKMGYHMWTQVWNGEDWLDLDAAYDEPITSPIRILLGVDDLSEADAFGEMIAVVEFLGQTEIEVVEVVE